MHLLAHSKGMHLQALVVHLSKPRCTSLGYPVSLSRILRKTHADITNVGDPTDLDIQILCKSCRSLAARTQNAVLLGNIVINKTNDGQLYASSLLHTVVTCCQSMGRLLQK